METITDADKLATVYLGLSDTRNMISTALLHVDNASTLLEVVQGLHAAIQAVDRRLAVMLAAGGVPMVPDEAQGSLEALLRASIKSPLN